MRDVVSLSAEDARLGRVLAFASAAHASVGQTRKYTHDPYIVHPIAVANIVLSRPHNRFQVEAALLHDVVEDTGVTIERIDAEFGAFTALLVADVTDVSRLSDGNRAVRKAKDRQHTARALPASKTIKLADLIENAGSILAHDPQFAVTFMKEKRALLEVLTEGDEVLWQQANAIVEAFFHRIGPRQAR